MGKSIGKRKEKETEKQPTKEQKPEGIEDRFQLLFKKATEEINRRYLRGTLEFIRVHHHDLHRKISDREDRLDDLWKVGTEATLEQFHKLLREWYALHLRGIELYSKEQGEGRE